MLDIADDALVVEEKGIYSIENFLNARRLMYWQVYLHKTAISAETMLIQIVRRARELTQRGGEVFASPPLALFLREQVSMDDFLRDPQYLNAFQSLDDYDVWGAVKIWTTHRDPVLSTLSRMLLDRKLFRIVLSPEKPDSALKRETKTRLGEFYGLRGKDLDYFYVEGFTSNAAYLSQGTGINIRTKKGRIMDIAAASDLPNIKAMSKLVRKYYACWAKEIRYSF